MTVSELIAHLQTLEPDAEVVIPEHSTRYCEVRGACRDWAAFDPGGVQLTYGRDSDARRVVRLIGR